MDSDSSPTYVRPLPTIEQTRAPMTRPLVARRGAAGRPTSGARHLFRVWLSAGRNRADRDPTPAAHHQHGRDASDPTGRRAGTIPAASPGDPEL